MLEGVPIDLRRNGIGYSLIRSSSVDFHRVSIKMTTNPIKRLKKILAAGVAPDQQKSTQLQYIPAYRPRKYFVGPDRARVQLEAASKRRRGGRIVRSSPFTVLYVTDQVSVTC